MKASFLNRLNLFGAAPEPEIEDFFRPMPDHGENGKTKPLGDEPGSLASDRRELQAKDWTNETTYDGQLAVDVYQDEDAIIVKSTIAGVCPQDIDVSLNNDLLTIKGVRTMNEEVDEGDFFYRECYWGGFSRSIILPVDVLANQVEAKLENGILTIRLPKAEQIRATVIPVK